MNISTKGLLYNPFDPKTVETLQDRYEEFRLPTGHLKIEKVVTWVILMYDLKSEMRMQFPDWRQRKIECARLADWDYSVKTGRFQDSVMEMLNGENEAVNDMICRYCLLFPSPYYSAYVALWEMLVRETRASLDAKDSKTIETMRKNITEMTKQISVYSELIYGGETTVGLQNSLFKTINREKLRLRPEDIAEDIKDKDLSLPDPYYDGDDVVEEEKTGAGRPQGSLNKKTVIYKTNRRKNRGRPKTRPKVEK